MCEIGATLVLWSVFILDTRLFFILFVIHSFNKYISDIYVSSTVLNFIQEHNKKVVFCPLKFCR